MFVPHEPNFCFDVYRGHDRCVCGASAVVTGDNGYCNHCNQNRNLFVNNIVGTIKNGLPYFEIMENIRDNAIREKLYFVIDSYFGNERVKVEPYSDSEFYLKCLNEKISSTEVFLTTLSKTIGFGINDKKKPKRNIQSDLQFLHFKYIVELTRMQKTDLDRYHDILNNEEKYQFVKTSR